MNDRGRFTEQTFWRGEGLHVHPELSAHTAAFWMGNAKAEVLNGAPALQTPSGPNSNSLMPNLMKSNEEREGKK